MKSEIIISDEQIDETGKIVRQPVLIFAAGGERLGLCTCIRTAEMGHSSYLHTSNQNIGETLTVTVAQFKMA
jgi:hypothetical protein